MIPLTELTNYFNLFWIYGHWPKHGNFEIDAKYAFCLCSEIFQIISLNKQILALQYCIHSCILLDIFTLFI